MTKLCTVYPVLLEASNEEAITEEIKTKYPKLVELSSHHDLIENYNDVCIGYRAAGIYFIDKSNDKFRIKAKDYDYDDYGTIRPEYVTFDEIPLGYFQSENCFYNYSFHQPPKHHDEFYWHDDYPVFLNLDKLGPNLDGIFIHNNISYHVDASSMSGIQYFTYSPKSKTFYSFN